LLSIHGPTIAPMLPPDGCRLEAELYSPAQTGLWSHYSSKHRDMLLAFDVQQRGEKPIEYLRQRPILKIPPTVEDVNRPLFSKFIG